MTTKSITFYQIVCGIGLFIFLLLSNVLNTEIVDNLLSNETLFTSVNTIYLLINVAFVFSFFLLENQKKHSFLLNLSGLKHLIISWVCFFSLTLGMVLSFEIVSVDFFNKTTVSVMLTLILIFLYYPLFLTLRFLLFYKKSKLSKRNNSGALLLTYILVVFLLLLI